MPCCCGSPTWGPPDRRRSRRWSCADGLAGRRFVDRGPGPATRFGPWPVSRAGPPCGGVCGPGPVRFGDIGEGDDDLVSAAQAGDRPALEALLRSHHDRLYAVCRRLTGNDADAADATQETLIAVVRGLPRFDGRSRFGTWSYRIAVNASLDELRRRRRRPEPGLDDQLPEGEPVRMAGANSGDIAAHTADRVDIDVALGKLTPDFRAAVVLRDLCGLDYAEIAEILDIPPGTVRSRIARGRSALLPLLGGNPTAATERPSERP